MRTLAVLSLVAVVAAAGCTARPDPSPTVDTTGARQAAAELAAALEKKDLSTVAFSGGVSADASFRSLVRGMGSLAPQVDVIDVDAQSSSATATLSYSWSFPGLAEAWTYQADLQLVRDAGTWHPTWAPAVLEPELDGTNRMTQRRLAPQRGELLGADDEPVISDRSVVRLGIDKTRVDPGEQERSSTRLARLVGIDQKKYAALVEAAGDQAFVEAIVLRTDDDDRPSSTQLDAIPGAVAIRGTAMLAPNRDFARALVGRVGQATADIVKSSQGTVVAGDEVGLDGLEKRYDDQLRGSPGVLVQLVPADTSGSSGGSPSPSPSGSSTSTSGATTAYEVKAADGRAVRTTLDVDLQTLAEKTLEKSGSAASLVAIRPSTGALLVAANNTDTDGQPVATFGQVQPGSTFKVISALALLRRGLDPDSEVQCPRTIRVGGRTYENYDDYPASKLGRIDLATAFAQSCNTAFIGQRGRLRSTDLQTAAASLGVGTDYDVGFPAAFGSVPTGGNENAQAEAIFGQGKDQVSPLAMALVAASVQAGHTVLPTLVSDEVASSQADPLSSSEAATLKQLMRGVVTEGSGRRLDGLPGPDVIAKTGTAEYGSKTPPDTHAWMIAAQGDLAVAVFVQDGDSGSGVAGPLLEAFLRGAR